MKGCYVTVDDGGNLCHVLLTRQYTKNPELSSMRCGDEFGLELNWNGALNHVLWFCGGIGAAGML